MATEIHPLALGGCTCYLVRDEGLVLVDTGSPNQGERFLERVRDLSIEAEDISLILLTHGHWDHIGSASEIKSLTGCEVATNHHEREWVEQGLKPVPPGVGFLGKVFGTMLKLYMPFVRIAGTPVDVVLEDEEFSMEPYGIRGSVLHTPGHSSGSMTLLLDSGEAFVGDLAMNGLPRRLGPGMPPFAEDIDVVKESWRYLLDRGAKWIYPAHGKPFKAEALKTGL